eukprot:CAMPEP_0116992744 /NCGR_PEP_ID=MMETSP0467-20121206/66998_1 /TAXON_ID=283647 /ORGANISM="Mesodinium pulex, Strain SPMC105" /LENGTH=283 /DNA_ID=CAMNT_0004690241 /DNA_START=429 /DNA_END=1279 /DNA_ORIENTATION=-
MPLKVDSRDIVSLLEFLRISGLNMNFLSSKPDTTLLSLEQREYFLDFLLHQHVGFVSKAGDQEDLDVFACLVHVVLNFLLERLGLLVEDEIQFGDLEHELVFIRVALHLVGVQVEDAPQTVLILGPETLLEHPLEPAVKGKEVAHHVLKLELGQEIGLVFDEEILDGVNARDKVLVFVEEILDAVNARDKVLVFDLNVGHQLLLVPVVVVFRYVEGKHESKDPIVHLAPDVSLVELQNGGEFVDVFVEGFGLAVVVGLRYLVQLGVEQEFVYSTDFPLLLEHL